MRTLLLLVPLYCLFTSVATASEPYFQYPTGHIAIERIYQAIAPERKALRACHQEYLFHIPGAFDALSLQFQIDPEGKAIPFAGDRHPKPKQKAIGCITSIIRSIIFPKPEMGIVFVLFESDLQQYGVTDLKKAPLSRNAVQLVPFVPQKIASAMIEMYMPYYKQCFLQIPKKNRPVSITLTWTITTNGQTENIVPLANTLNQKAKSCITQVTKEHRYPTGYAPTKITRNFDIK